MKKILAVMLFLFAAFASGADYSAVRGTEIFIPVDVPEGKLGGGDFYNITVEPADGDYSAFEYTAKTDGIRLKFLKAGSFDLKITVNHITKSTCASVHVTEFKSIPVNILVSE